MIASMVNKTTPSFLKEDFRPDIMERIEADRLDSTRLTVALPTPENERVHVKERHQVFITDGEGVTDWKAPSLRELFRGTQPVSGNMEAYPPEYVPCFYFIERHVLLLCDVTSDRPDGELEEAYSNLRRRPDGRSLGLTHDFLWQTAAVLLAMRPLSQAEFEGILGRLAGSARTWRTAPSSRNYTACLRKSPGGSAPNR